MLRKRIWYSTILIRITAVLCWWMAWFMADPFQCLSLGFEHNLHLLVDRTYPFCSSLGRLLHGKDCSFITKRARKRSSAWSNPLLFWLASFRNWLTSKSTFRIKPFRPFTHQRLRPFGIIAPDQNWRIVIDCNRCGTLKRFWHQPSTTVFSNSSDRHCALPYAETLPTYHENYFLEPSDSIWPEKRKSWFYSFLIWSSAPS